MSHSFTVEEANRTLPLVRRIVEDIVAQHRRWEDRVREFELLSAGGLASSALERATVVQREAMDLAAEIDGFVSELNRLQIHIKDFGMGLIDFPSEIEGRPVYLCWTLGEPDVRFWHEPGAGYAGRRPLSAVAVG